MAQQAHRLERDPHRVDDPGFDRLGPAHGLTALVDQPVDPVRRRRPEVAGRGDRLQRRELVAHDAGVAQDLDLVVHVLRALGEHVVLVRAALERGARLLAAETDDQLGVGRVLGRRQQEVDPGAEDRRDQDQQRGPDVPEQGREGVAEVEGRALDRVGGGQVGLPHVPDLTVAVVEVLAAGPVM